MTTELRPRTCATLAIIFALGATSVGAGCKSEGDNSAGPPDPATVVVDYDPSPLKRLTKAQYGNAVRDVFGDDVVVPTRLEPDVESAGSINIGAGKTTISPRGAELYESAAYDVAAQVVGRLDQFAPCAPAEAGDTACYADIAAQLGLRLWRRPLTSEEVDRVAGVGALAANRLDSWQAGAEFVVAALLQSPHFLFRNETGALEEASARRLDSWELASRLSFFLWNSGPDVELLEAAKNGELDTEDGLAAHAERMLADPRARRGLRALFTDLYGLHHLGEVTKAPEVYPHFSDTFGESAREETLRMLEHHVFDERGDFRDILTTKTTFVNRELAAVYNVRAPVREGFGRVDFAEDDMRAGLLGHASILSLYSHPVATSPTLRGMFVRTRLLCQMIPPPPADVDTSIPEPSGDAPTLRARIQEHLQNPACSSCHQLTDPIGLGMENFDGVGRFRDTENGYAIDASGTFDRTDFTDMSGLAVALRDHPKLTSCFARSLYGYATGQEVRSNEQALVDALDANFSSVDYDVLELMKLVVTSSGFRYAGVSDDADAAQQGGQP
jgi:hypothetical protein